MMITALYNRHRICHRCEAGEDEDRRLDAGGGVFVQGDTGHAPHQLLRHGQADQNQDLRPGTLSFQIYDYHCIKMCPGSLSFCLLIHVRVIIAVKMCPGTLQFFWPMFL